MIQETEEIKSMLHNIIQMTNIIKDDFQKNGETHCKYILEKLNRAKWDLDILIEIAQKKYEENLDNKTEL